jgi:hypothetical protein
MSGTVVLTAGFVLCILAVIVAIARRDAPTAAAGCLGAVILGVLAVLSGESSDERDPHPQAFQNRPTGANLYLRYLYYVERLHVRFGPKATGLPRVSEMTRRAIS